MKLPLERMIVLAAGTGSRLHPLTAERPKCLVPVGGRPILEYVLSAARSARVETIVLVGGYRSDMLREYGAELVRNQEYESSNMLASLFCAEQFFGDGFVLSYGDIIYTPEVLERCAGSPAPVSVVIDTAWRAYWEDRFEDPLRDAESLRLDGAGRILDIGQKVSRIEEIQAQYIGLLAFRGEGVEWLRQAHDALGQRARRAYMTDVLMQMITMSYPVTAVPISGGWAEIDRLEDIPIAERRLRSSFEKGL